MKLFARICLFVINWFVIFISLLVAAILFVSPYVVIGGYLPLAIVSGLLAAIYGLAGAIVNGD